MSLFTGDSRTVSKFAKRSAGIISVFTRTQAELTAVSNELLEEEADRQEQIEILLAEQANLKLIRLGNTKIVNKIYAFFSDSNEGEGTE